MSMSNPDNDLASCVAIEPVRDLHVTKDDGKTVRIFTEKQSYKVHGWRQDLWVVDDTGADNLVGGEYLATNFLLHRTVR
ncbi:hypothetical protein RPSD_52410 (plasmid) [Ralstonia solanacearum]|nr:hypothetical protein RPSD_52410 [Ralstonia solanacearum]